MLGWLKSVFFPPPKRMVDPLFGEIVYLADAKFWEATVEFAPTGKRVELGIDAGPEGPGEAQREIFGQIVERYPSLMPLIEPIVAKEAVEWGAPQGAPVLPLLQLTGLSIPEEQSPEMEWTISFDSKLRSNPSFDVQMRGWSPTGSVEVAT